MNEEEFIYYVTVALKNLGYNKAGIFNVEGEIKRLIKLYSTEEIKAKVAKMK
ncbi:hypothetical protein [Enterococcus caccae]|uniref:Uncharacterized protein n=1 Tax=Enterococcus caccae ATCC BAA-1240 TaxID=1158612 RepID=R3WEW3_9ENTE|nr:hypothetical protein [Enterococcus caccae]EOL46396.1 hypothetical protein UC7_01363 [Enterococcus caccae ATCC BAA-1240]EOT60765.1 hypothetical protein I580_01665 [Enterococcus caccae ATCC BAA-1240]OJG27425.1 hypothetical protein RU98_GL002514 [Enterococcus caccae]